MPDEKDEVIILPNYFKNCSKAIFRIVKNKKDKKVYYSVISDSPFAIELKKKYKAKILAIYNFFDKIDIEVTGWIDPIGNVNFTDIYLNDNFLDYDFLEEIFNKFSLPIPKKLYEGIYSHKIKNEYLGNIIKTLPEKKNRILEVL